MTLVEARKAVRRSDQAAVPWSCWGRRSGGTRGSSGCGRWAGSAGGARTSAPEHPGRLRVPGDPCTRDSPQAPQGWEGAF